MNDLLSEMQSDSGDAPDKLDTLDSGKLDGVARLAAEAANLERQISDAEQLLKDRKQALHKITDEQLPEALEEMGLQKFTLTDGAEISVKPLYAASIPRDRKDEAFQWLGRGEDDIAKEFVGLCGSQGFTPTQLEKVEPMTLKAWLRERVEAGDPIPLDLFGAFISQRATIKRSK